MTQNDLADFQHENGIIPLKSADYLERAWKFRTFALSEEEDHSNPLGSEKYLSGAPKIFSCPGRKNRKPKFGKRELINH